MRCCINYKVIFFINVLGIRYFLRLRLGFRLERYVFFGCWGSLVVLDICGEYVRFDLGFVFFRGSR